MPLLLRFCICCGAVRAGPPGPALANRVNISARLKEADEGVGRGPGVRPTVNVSGIGNVCPARRMPPGIAVERANCTTTDRRCRSGYAPRWIGQENLMGAILLGKIDDPLAYASLSVTL